MYKIKQQLQFPAGMNKVYIVVVLVIAYESNLLYETLQVILHHLNNNKFKKRKQKRFFLTFCVLCLDLTSKPRNTPFLCAFHIPWV